MIPEKGWKPMESAPRNGEILMVKSREWNHPGAALQVQPGQWLCNSKGQDWRWRLPDRQGTTVYADGWMTFSEFRAAQQAAGFDEKAPQAAPPPMTPSRPDLIKPAAPTVEFDL